MPVVDVRQLRRGGPGDDGGAHHPALGVVVGLARVLPELVEPGQRHDVPVGRVQVVRLLALAGGPGLGLLPLEVAVGGQQRAPNRERAGERRLLPIDSTRALIIRLPIEMSLAQDGTSPQRATRSCRVISPVSLSARSTTMRTPSVGATFHDGPSSRTSSAIVAIANSSARAWSSRKDAYRPHMGPACQQPPTSRLAGPARRPRRRHRAAAETARTERSNRFDKRIDRWHHGSR